MGRAEQEIGTLLVFSEGKMACALAAAEVQEVLFLPELSHPPGMPSMLEGIMTLDGEAVPVIRVAILLGLEGAALDVYTPVMVLKDAKAALIVERVDDIFTPAKADLVLADEGQSFNGCVMAKTSHKGREIHVLSAGRLMIEEEKQRLAEFKAQLQARLACEGQPAP